MNMTQFFSRTTLLTTLFAGTTLFSSGCELKKPCDEGDSMEYGLCIPKETIEAREEEAAGGSAGASSVDPGDGDSSTGECGSPPSEPPNLDDHNIGEECDDLNEECGFYDGTDCVGGTTCGGSRFPQCVALCGPGDAFEDACPSDYTCTDLGEAQLCWK